jgi:hypothetical protein
LEKFGLEQDPELEPHHVGEVPAWKNVLAPASILSFDLYSEKFKN